jgi:DNA-binding PucR family transcriptional regulator
VRPPDRPDAEHTFWAWIGAPRQLDFADLERSVATVSDLPTISAGEPRDGAGGWRLSHLEAESAAPVAQLEKPGLVRHANVALLASALCHEATGRSLTDRYLKPLDRHRDGEDLRRTLRAYFELSCNAASTASALGVNRHTVQRRLKRVEESIGQPSSSRHAEFSVALRLEQLTSRTHTTADR